MILHGIKILITEALVREKRKIEPIGWESFIQSITAISQYHFLRNIYPGNTASSFQIRYQKTMYLKNKYEIALAEIQYSHTWETFTNEEFSN